MLIKALAPILGEFSGKGSLLDGTEFNASFVAQEIIPNLCYGMRLQINSLETLNSIVNSYIVASIDSKTDELELHLIDTRESFHDLHKTHSSEVNGTTFHTFQAKRSSGGLYKVEFGIPSASQFSMAVSVSSAKEALVKCLWRVEFKRVHSLESLLESTQVPQTLNAA